MKFDDAMFRRLEAMYAAPDVVARRRAVMHALAVRSGEKILDVASSLR
jgi:hypothetical protein